MTGPGQRLDAVGTTGDDADAESVDEDEWDGRSPRWPWIAGLVLCVVGFGVSGYLTYEHYTGSTSLACPAAGTHGVVNCLKVTTSAWSTQNGIPVAVLGLVYFAVMSALQTPRAWRSHRFVVRAGRIAWCIVGIIAAIRLVYFELHDIQAICEWCTSVHVITFVLYVSTLIGTYATASYAEH